MQIKAFSEKYKVPIDTIRFYEKEGLLKPDRKDNGYRQYDEECANQLILIIVLKQLGFTVQEIYQLTTFKMDQFTPECNQTAVSMFESKRQQLAEKIHFYQRAVQTLDTVKQLMQEEKYLENQMVIQQSISELFNQVHLEDV